MHYLNLFKNVLQDLLIWHKILVLTKLPLNTYSVTRNGTFFEKLVNESHQSIQLVLREIKLKKTILKCSGILLFTKKKNDAGLHQFYSTL